MLSGSFPPGPGVMPGGEGSGLAARQWIIVTPAKAGVQGAVGTLGSGSPAFAGMTGGANHQRLDTLAGAEQVDRPLFACQGQALREVAGALGDDRRQPLTFSGIDNDAYRLRYVY